MLSKWIKKIRSKPDSVKRGITLSISFGFTAIVAVFWFISYINYSSELLQKKSAHNPLDFLHDVGSEIGESYARTKERVNVVDIFKPRSSSTTSDTVGVMASDTVGTTDSTATVNIGTTSDTMSITESDGADVSIGTNAGINTGKVNQASIGASASLDDILNTKKPVNQESNATTSN